jgi:hypothetical protein
MKTPRQNLEELMPSQGFIKTTGTRVTGLTSEQRILLNRKGNEFFNAGNVNQAKKIFLATGYSDGLIRLGDYYQKNNDPFEALRLYKLAPAPEKAGEIIEKMAQTLRKMIQDGE